MHRDPPRHRAAPAPGRRGRALAARLAKVVVGDPSVEGVRMGALASHAQQADVAERVALLRQGAEVVYRRRRQLCPGGRGHGQRRLLPAHAAAGAQRRLANNAVHDVEAFGPVSTLMPYDGMEEALAAGRARQGQPGLLAGHARARRRPPRMVPALAALHGRVHVLDRDPAAESTGHGSPLPLLKHGGPGRAGGGEELGGLRAVTHLLQRAAVQGSPTMLTAVTARIRARRRGAWRPACTRSAATSKNSRSASRC